MKMKKMNIFAILLSFVLLLSSCDFTLNTEVRECEQTSTSKLEASEKEDILEDLDKIKVSEALEGSDKVKVSFKQEYYEKDEVAAYIHKFNALPPNYISKQRAKEINWRANDGSGLVIGGNRFGNREGILPEERGRQYYECDLIEGYTTHRGASRLVYSNDGLVFYTNDHYESFEQLY